MKIEEKLKAKYLYSSKLNLFKIIYFFYQFIKFKFKPRIINSNWGLDVIICDIFKNKDNGIYVDVGCHHPFINNNTYLLHKKGWKGLNVDLDFSSINMFNYFRPNDDNKQAAVSNKKDTVKFYFFHNRAPKNTISKKSGKGAKLIKNIETTNLNNILKDSKLNIQQIDFLSIDVEGNEINVLKGLDFKKYKPKVVALEFLDPKKKEFYFHNIKNIEKSEIYKFMKKHKYKLVNWIHDDLLFISTSFSNKK
tara:strand:+ start:2386 stop:3135 length:750 start_codon:yes stop_codon:yes gene_type:complete